ncbi:hypothetical protein ACFLZ1_03235 [Patescibacteria group bacterium]
MSETILTLPNADCNRRQFCFALAAALGAAFLPKSIIAEEPSVLEQAFLGPTDQPDGQRVVAGQKDGEDPSQVLAAKVASQDAAAMPDSSATSPPPPTPPSLEAIDESDGVCGPYERKNPCAHGDCSESCPPTAVSTSTPIRLISTETQDDIKQGLVVGGTCLGVLGGMGLFIGLLAGINSVAEKIRGMK